MVSIPDERASPGQRYYEAVRAALPEMPETDSLETVAGFICRAKGPGYFREGGA